MTYVLDHQDKPDDKNKEFNTKDEAEERKNDLVSLGAKPEKLEIRKKDVVDAEIVDQTENGSEPVEESTGETTEIETKQATDLASGVNKAALETSFIEWFGGRDSPFITEVSHGQNSSLDLNKDGTQFVANLLNFEVKSECIISAHETDFEYAKYEATCVRPDGRESTAVGDCHIDESGKGPEDLERQAETRSKKRSVKWSSSGGIEAVMQALGYDDPLQVEE